MKYPDVQFRINEALDLWTAKEFGVGTPDDVQSNYKANSGELLSFVTTAKKLWDEVSPAYFEVVSDIFHQHYWPDGAYVGYASIFDCNPRFLESKTFQLYHKHKAGSSYVTAHELLHFMFYDYGMKKHSDLFKNHDTEAGIFWDTAEILNSVLLHSPRFLSILHVKEPVLYPEHEGFVKQLRAVWDKNNDIDNFIIEAHTLISHEQRSRHVEKMCSTTTNLPYGGGDTAKGLSPKNTMELYVIKNSAIDGQGAFARSLISAKEVVGLAFIHQHTTGNPDTDYTRTKLGEFTNHSDTPNMRISVDGKNIYFVAVMHIEPSTELTVNYHEFGWEGKVNFMPPTKEG